MVARDSIEEGIKTSQAKPVPAQILSIELDRRPWLAKCALHREIQVVDDIAPALQILVEKEVQATLCYGSNLTHSHMSKTTALASKHRPADIYILRGPSVMVV